MVVRRSKRRLNYGLYVPADLPPLNLSFGLLPRLYERTAQKISPSARFCRNNGQI
jgi:hypothetical protein